MKVRVLDFNIVLFDDFETLDALGPAEIIGRRPDLYNVKYYSMFGGIVTSRQKAPIHTLPLNDMEHDGILLVPGGAGTKNMMHHKGFLQQLTEFAQDAPYVLGICTGSSLLAKTGVLNGHNATTNKHHLEWVKEIAPNVNWMPRGRWIKSDKFYTSSGAGTCIDMVLAFLNDIHGRAVADDICSDIEYIWNSDPLYDPFALKF